MPPSRVSDASTWLLSRANARAQRLLSEGFAAFGLRPLHYRMLAAIDEHGSLSQADLGRELDLDRKDVALAVDLLADRDMVKRTLDPRDGRRKIVALTDTGREAVPRLDLALDEVQSKVLAPLTPEEVAQLRAALSKLMDLDADPERHRRGPVGQPGHRQHEDRAGASTGVRSPSPIA